MCKVNVNGEGRLSTTRIPTGGRLTSRLFTSVGKELELGITVLQI